VVGGERLQAGGKRVMRKLYRVLVFAALVAALVAPVGFALSLEPAPWAPVRLQPVGAPHADGLAVALRLESATSANVRQQGSDALGLLLAGAGLLGLAAVVRKTI
jgi:hypothetical protein